jgi:hypothetical protein
MYVPEFEIPSYVLAQTPWPGPHGLGAASTSQQPVVVLSNPPTTADPLAFFTGSFQTNPGMMIAGLTMLLTALYLYGVKRGPDVARRKREAIQKKIDKLRAEQRNLE